MGRALGQRGCRLQRRQGYSRVSAPCLLAPRLSLPLKPSSRSSLPPCRRDLHAGVRQLAAASPAPDPLLPTATAGLLAVACTAKGQRVHGARGVEAAELHAASGGLPMAGFYADGELGPFAANGRLAVQWVGAGGGGGGGTDAADQLQGFTTIATVLGATP